MFLSIDFMSVKILGGMLGGLVLVTPKGNLIRPSAANLKRKIFDSRQDFTGKIFIDACAGSGAMGLTAWSRNADQLWLVEADKNVFKILKKNVDKVYAACKDESRKIHLVRKDFESWILRFKKNYRNWDEEKKKNTIVFIDPPYQETKFYRKTIKCLVSGWYKGEIWIESDEKKGIPLDYWKEIKKIYLVKSFHQGDGHIAIFQIH